MRVQALLATSDRFVCAKNSGEFGDLYESCFPRANVRGGFNGRWCIDESRCHPCGVINAAPSSRLCEREKEREIRRLRISLAMTISRLFNVVACKRGRDSRTSFLETSDDVTSRPFYLRPLVSVVTVLSTLLRRSLTRVTRLIVVLRPLSVKPLRSTFRISIFNRRRE